MRNIFGLVLLLVASVSWGQATSRLQVSAGYDHYLGFRNDADPEGLFIFTGAYQLSEKQTLLIRQDVVKAYMIVPGDSEFQPVDTSLRYLHTLPVSLGSATYSVRVGVTLPVSNFSQRNGVQTISSLGLVVDKKLMGEKLQLVVRPTLAYVFNEYRTSVSGMGQGGGKPLKQAMAIVDMRVVYAFTEALSVAVTGAWTYNSYERVGLTNAISNLGVENLPDNTYSWSASLGYKLSPTVSLSAGLSHESKAERSGGIEVVAYDPQVTQFAMGAAITF